MSRFLSQVLAGGRALMPVFLAVSQFLWVVDQRGSGGRVVGISTRLSTDFMTQKETWDSTSSLPIA